MLYDVNGSPELITYASHKQRSSVYCAKRIFVTSMSIHWIQIKSAVTKRLQQVFLVWELAAMIDPHVIIPYNANTTDNGYCVF